MARTTAGCVLCLGGQRRPVRASRRTRRNTPMHPRSSAVTVGAVAAPPAQPRPAQAFLDRIRTLRLADAGALDEFLAARDPRLAEFADGDRMAAALVQAGLLTRYQMSRLRAGTTHGLVLGAYRVLEELGSGG